MIKKIYSVKKQYYFEPPMFQATIDDRETIEKKEANIDLSCYLAPTLSDVTMLTVKGNYLNNCGISDNDVLICSKFESPKADNLVYVRNLDKKSVMLYQEIDNKKYLQEVDTKKQINIDVNNNYLIIGVIKHIIHDKAVSEQIV